MESVLFYSARALLSLIQALPLKWAARLGRAAGLLVYYLDGRHRRVAMANLTMCFGEQKGRREIRKVARENFCRIGENFACAVRTSAMTFDELRPHVEFIAPPLMEPPNGRKVVAAIGHFGNFELYARFAQFHPAYKCATTYRGVRQPALNRLMQSMRERSGCFFFERRFDAAALKSFMNQPATLLGLLADQHAGTNGLRLPFMGHVCSTSAAPAVFALRYDCLLYPAICYRVGLAQWRLELGDQIPTHDNDGPRRTEAIMMDVNRAFEVAVRKDPANWFWVHNRWKARNSKTSSGSLVGSSADAMSALEQPASAPLRGGSGQLE